MQADIGEPTATDPNRGSANGPDLVPGIKIVGNETIFRCIARRVPKILWLTALHMKYTGSNCPDNNEPNHRTPVKEKSISVQVIGGFHAGEKV
jgi:hypothetical protein